MWKYRVVRLRPMLQILKWQSVRSGTNVVCYVAAHLSTFQMPDVLMRDRWLIANLSDSRANGLRNETPSRGVTWGSMRLREFEKWALTYNWCISCFSGALFWPASRPFVSFFAAYHFCSRCFSDYRQILFGLGISHLLCRCCLLDRAATKKILLSLFNLTPKRTQFRITRDGHLIKILIIIKRVNKST